jgi:hypothetical protein
VSLSGVARANFSDAGNQVATLSAFNAFPKANRVGWTRIMSQIAVVWRVVGPLLLDHRLVSSVRHWFTWLVRLLGALGVAGGSYGLTMLVTIEIYPSKAPFAWFAYSAGLSLATWIAACAGALSARGRQQQLVANIVAALSMCLPMYLAFGGNVTGGQQTIILVYAVGAGLGGLAAIRTLAALEHSAGVPTPAR